MKACKKCMRIVEEKTCPVCNGPTTQYWSGYVGVLDPDNSKIAERINIETPGEYVLKVR